MRASGDGEKGLMDREGTGRGVERAWREEEREIAAGRRRDEIAYVLVCAGQGRGESPRLSG